MVEPRQRPEYQTRLSRRERLLLAQRYAPILILFPEDETLPRPDGRRKPDPLRGDYHPRPVDIILDNAYLYPGFWHCLKHPREHWRIDQSGPWLRYLPQVLRNRLPPPKPNAHTALPRIWEGESDYGINAVLDLVGIGRDRLAADRAWEEYFNVIERGGKRYRPKVYARVLQGNEVIEWNLWERLRWYRRVIPELENATLSDPGLLADVLVSIEQRFSEWMSTIASSWTSSYARVNRPTDIALQYWFLYYYNDWNNLHEVDWEVITLILRSPDQRDMVLAELQPEVLGYSSHVSGRRRPWSATEHRETHPVVYVALGSHACFYNYRPGGYAAGLPITVKVPWLNLHFSTHVRRWRSGYRDWVANSSLPDSAAILQPEVDYDLQVLPNLIPHPQIQSSADLQTLAWLTFPGYWGSRPLLSVGGSAPRGPLWQGLKSDNPFAWVKRVCQPDDIFTP